MSHEEFLKKVIQTKELAQKGATGTPQELAQKLGLSESTTFRLIQAMRNTGYRISYSKTRQSYILD